MLDYMEASQVAEKTARSAFGKKHVVRVFAEPGTDAEGHDALRITIVLTPDAVENLEGDALLKNLLDLREGLWQQGEERTPIVGYATEEELAQSGDTES
ncbi:MAG TPA: hypothetical protein VG651_08020 [Stellaceae bacterium]|nr:hypothetical protein [Stellaceae bacterium]